MTSESIYRIEKGRLRSSSHLVWSCELYAKHHVMSGVVVARSSHTFDIAGQKWKYILFPYISIGKTCFYCRLVNLHRLKLCCEVISESIYRIEKGRLRLSFYPNEMSSSQRGMFSLESPVGKITWLVAIITDIKCFDINCSWY